MRWVGDLRGRQGGWRHLPGGWAAVVGWLVVACAWSWPGRGLSQSDRLRALPERVRCSIIAAVKFEVPVNVMLAIAELEGGKPGAWVRNHNGSFDVGPMQFNTAYLSQLERTYGIRPEDVARTGCYPYELAAWRVRQHVARDEGTLWQRVANYHSRTPDKNRKYRLRLMRKAQGWASWLASRFETVQAAPLLSTQVRPSSQTALVATSAEAHGATPASAPAVTRLPPVQVVAAAAGAHDAPQVPAAAKREPSPAHGPPRRGKRLGRPPHDAVDDGGEASLLSLVEQSSVDPADYAVQTWDSPSESIGTPHRGQLLNGIPIPDHPGYRIRNPRRAFVTEETAQWLTDGFDVAAALDAKQPSLMVLDASLIHGGPIHGHRSHQSGRDVDLSYFRRSCGRLCRQGLTTAQSLDAGRQWRLLAHWLRNQQVEFAFVDYSLQKALYREAQAAGANPAELRLWFQYPRGRSHPAGIVRHVANHRDHIHLRFACPAGDAECKATRLRAAPAPGSALGAEAGELWELIDSETEQADSALLDLLPTR